MLSALCFAGLLAPGRAAEPSSNNVRIALVNSLFRDTSPALIKIIGQPLKILMETQTGLSGELQTGGDAFQLAESLKVGKAQLGVFHGFEFAWVREKYPQLRPLVIAVKEHPEMYACLVTKAGGDVTGPDDLKGKTVSIPRFSREHCHLFLDRRCCATDNARTFFSQVVTPSDPDDALLDVIDGTVQAAVVEKGLLDKFQRYQPGRFAKLQVLILSEAFPSGVVVYCEKGLSDDVLKRFKDGMINATSTERGRDLLKMVRLDGFLPVPENYDQHLTDIAKAYPPPAPKK
jgi:ABC-type phosphate/phosphonate transport system substrate-binding protein